MAVTNHIPESSEPVRLNDEEVREQVYKALAEEVKSIFGEHAPRVNKDHVRDLLDSVTEIIFRVARKEGYFRFPKGYGSLKVVRLKPNPKPKRLPTGEMVPMPKDRVKLRYEEGAAVLEMLGSPPKTSFKRRFQRQSALAESTRKILDGSPV